MDLIVWCLVVYGLYQFGKLCKVKRLALEGYTESARFSWGGFFLGFIGVPVGLITLTLLFS